MKTYKKIMVLLLSLCMMSSLSLTVRAAGKEDYTYTIRLFAGAHGTFADGSDVIVYRGMKAGWGLPFSAQSLERAGSRETVRMEDGSKYYIQGIRESGKDNSDAGKIRLGDLKVTEDQDYVVAYGIRGKMVEYTVRFEDEDGNELAPSESYYGKTGDRPVVAFLYIEGYLPQAYNLTGLLTDNAADNVFTFVYSPISEEAAAAGAEAAATVTTTTTTTAGAGGAGAGAAGAAGAGAGAADAAAAAAAADAAGVQPDEFLEVGDEETPLANPGGEDGDNLRNVADERTPLSSGDFATMLWNIPVAGKIGILSILVLAGVGGGYVYARKKGKIGNAR